MSRIWFSGGGATAMVAALLISCAAQAQWMSQRIALVQGWNAVHIKVHPADPACATVFGVDGVEQVSWWNRDRIDDGTGSAITDFCSWYRNSSGEPNTFSRVVGDQCYLVKSTRNVSFLVTGIPAVPKGILSVFAQGGDARGVTLEGLYYPLRDGTLTPAFPLGVSNAFTGAPVRVAVREGSLLVLWETAACSPEAAAFEP